MPVTVGRPRHLTRPQRAVDQNGVGGLLRARITRPAEIAQQSPAVFQRDALRRFVMGVYVNELRVAPGPMIGNVRHVFARDNSQPG